MKMYRVYNKDKQPCDVEIETKRYNEMCCCLFYTKEQANDYIGYLKKLFNNDEDYYIKEINIKE